MLQTPHMDIIDSIMKMEFKSYKINLWILLLFACFICSSTYSDMGKMSSSQNHFGGSIQSQFNTKNNTRVIAQKGGLAILPCIVKVNSPATVSWIRRKDFQLLTVGLSTHSSDKRFLVEHTRHMGHWSLRIKSVKEEDRGFYECQLSIYPTQSIFIELKVVEAVAEISGAPDLHIDESSTLRLECKLKRATENPAFVFWYHDSKMVNYDMQGGFSVTSKMPDGQALNDNSLTLLSTRSSVAKTRGLSEETSRKQQEVSNSSNSSSYPPSSAPSLATATQHHSSFLLTPSISILTIKEVHFHHAGNYTCAPSNARPISITVHVLRGEKPAAMQHANSSIIDSDSSNNNNSISLSSSGVNGASALDLRITTFLGVKLAFLSSLSLSGSIQQTQQVKINFFFLFFTIVFNVLSGKS